MSMGYLCETCGIGFYLHSGDDARCDHCNSPRQTVGTQIAEDERANANKFTPAQRQELMEKSKGLIGLTREQAIEALNAYGTHTPVCRFDYTFPEREPCDCGWAEIKERINHKEIK